MNKTWVKLCYRFATLYRGRGEISNTLFKIPIILYHWLWVAVFMCMFIPCFRPQWYPEHTWVYGLRIQSCGYYAKCFCQVFSSSFLNLPLFTFEDKTRAHRQHWRENGIILCGRIYVMRCAIFYHLYNLKNVKNTHGGVLLHWCFSCF